MKSTSYAIERGFARRDKLASELARLDREIAQAGEAWARERGMGMRLRPERLRLAVKS